MLTANVSDVLNGGELRHPHAGNDAGGADGAGADTDFHGAGTGANKIARALLGDDISRDHRDVRKRPEFPDHFHDVAGVAGGGIDKQRVRTGVDQHAAAVDAIGSNTHGGTAAELAVVVLRGVGESDALLNIRAGDEADEAAV